MYQVVSYFGSNIDNNNNINNNNNNNKHHLGTINVSFSRDTGAEI